MAREGGRCALSRGEPLWPQACSGHLQPVDLGLLRPLRPLTLASVGCGLGPRSGAWAALCVEEGRQGPRSPGLTPASVPPAWSPGHVCPSGAMGLWARCCAASWLSLLRALCVFILGSKESAFLDNKVLSRCGAPSLANGPQPAHLSTPLTRLLREPLS